MALAISAALIVVGGCSKRDGGTTTPTSPTGAIGVALAPSAFTLAQGTSTTVALAISRTNFTDAVGFTSSGAPPA